MKKTLALVLALLMVVVALVGCKAAEPVASSAAPAPVESAAAPAGSDAAPAADLPLDVAVEVKGTESDFWQYMLVGANAYGTQYPDRVTVKTYGPAKEADQDDALQILEQIIDTQPDGIVLASASSEAPCSAIEGAYDAGIICVIVDNQILTDKYHAFMATDNIAGGALAADSLVEGMKAKGVTSGTYVGVSSSGGSKVMEARLKGFLDQMATYTEYTAYSGGVQFCENDVAKGLAICENIFSANKDLVGLFGGNNMSGNACAKFITNSGMSDKVTAVCYDSDPEEIAALRSGNLYAMVIQDPAGFGYYGIDMVYKIKVEGYDVVSKYADKYIDTGCTKITAENIDDPALAALIDPFALRDGKAERTWAELFK